MCDNVDDIDFYELNYIILPHPYYSSPPSQ